MCPRLRQNYHLPITNARPSIPPGTLVTKPHRQTDAFQPRSFQQHGAYYVQRLRADNVTIRE
jgi:hypothetical protein